MQKEWMKLVKKKYRFCCMLLCILFVSYFLIPFILTFVTDNRLRTVTIGNIPFIWLYTFMQIPLTWLLGWIYHYYAKKIDAQSERLLREGEHE